MRSMADVSVKFCVSVCDAIFNRQYCVRYDTSNDGYDERGERQLCCEKINPTYISYHQCHSDNTHDRPWISPYDIAGLYLRKCSTVTDESSMAYRTEGRRVLNITITASKPTRSDMLIR